MTNLKSYINPDLLNKEEIDPRWLESPFINLKRLKAKQAGARYEQVSESILTGLGYNVQKPLSSDHDRIINGKKTEMKGSMMTKAKKDGIFSFLQIRPDQDYEQILFTVFDFDSVKMYFMDKDTINKKIEEGIFKKQHGGNKGTSRTFSYNGTIEGIGEGLKEVTI